MSKSNSKVLIIDDDAEIRYSLDRVLSTQNLQVISSDSGEKALKQPRQSNLHLSF